MKLTLINVALLACLGLSTAHPTAMEKVNAASSVRSLENALLKLLASGVSGAKGGRGGALRGASHRGDGSQETTEDEMEEFEQESEVQEFEITPEGPQRRGFYNFQSAGFPTSYNDYSSQTFQASLSGTIAYVLKVNFLSFSVEAPNADGSCNDKVSVHDGYSSSDPVIAEFCGTRTPFTVYTSGQTITVFFAKVNNGLTGTGFSAEFDYVRKTDVPADANQFDSPAAAPAPAPVPTPAPTPAPVATPAPASGNIGPDANRVTIIVEGVREQCLYAHNYVRRLHRNTPDMTYDVSMESSAQDWAKYLATNDLFEHATGRNNAGENLYKRWGWGYSSPPATSARAVHSWWDEYKDYDFASGQSTGGVIGHFTQVVWTTSTKVACGVATVERGQYLETYIVGRYSGAGNYGGQYTTKVKNFKAGVTLPTAYTQLEP